MSVNSKIMLTGAAGFIGSNFVKKIATQCPEVNFLVVDFLGYAGHKETIQQELDSFRNLEFKICDIRYPEQIKSVTQAETLKGIINFAAESHVDRSIDGPRVFFETNTLGVLNLLELSLEHYERNPSFRFLQVSTDEVYGSLGPNDPAFTEDTPLAPNSPYSASKASGDLAVRSYFHTFGLPTVITRCSNNYGPYQYPEKLIPLMIQRAKNNEPLPVYGNGLNIRDWIYVDDHNRGIWEAFLQGKAGEVYNFGGHAEMRNIDIVKLILKKIGNKESLIQFVEDRKGHDFRYAVSTDKARNELGWRPMMPFEKGIEQTIDWYLENTEWCKLVEAKT